jgi:hypothetical protein
VERSDYFDGPWQIVGTTSVASMTDSPPLLSTPKTFVYRVSCLDAGGSLESGPSPLDYATVATTLFTDDPLVAGSTIIKGAHIVELRKAVDQVRIAARVGANPSWSYSSPTGFINRQDNIDLRTALDAAAVVILGHGISYGGSPPTIGGIINATDYQQIRDGVK